MSVDQHGVPYPPGHPYARIASGEEAIRLQKKFGIGLPPSRQIPIVKEW